MARRPVADSAVPPLPEALSEAIPESISGWFARRGWSPRPHQRAMVAAGASADPVLLIAPTGGGKTLAGFLPSLIELTIDQPPAGLHTLYLSPLKALNVDVARNLMAPIAEMALPITVETRSADTPTAKRQRQKQRPPAILLTTPEQLALLLAAPEAAELFAGLRRVIIDEVHALWAGKRGDLLALGLEQLATLAPGLQRVGLSATVADPPAVGAWLAGGAVGRLRLIEAGGGAAPIVRILDSAQRLPWAGHSARHALAEILALIAEAAVTLVFVNTRAQAEQVFQGLWQANEDNLPIALHHGSLAAEQRRKVEAAMSDGRLKAVVCTATLDLGIDWGAVDQVIQIGAPKGAARLIQRIGRANHRLDQPSRAVLVPANRFEVLECQAALAAIAEGALDPEPPRRGALDVLAQHLLGLAVGGGLVAETAYAMVTRAMPYRQLARADFDRVLDYLATGGYALRRYDRFQRLRLVEGVWRITGPEVARQYRLNIGTIIDAPMIEVRCGRQSLGQVEEWFIDQLVPGHHFLLSGRIVEFIGMRETVALVRPSNAREPQIPSYEGGKFPLSSFLADRVRRLLANPDHWDGLPVMVRDWLVAQQRSSRLPGPDDLLIETFPRAGRHYLVAYSFAGRPAHQTLGMLLTRRLERAGLAPLGFIASDYALAVWSLRPVPAADLASLFDQDMMGDDLEAWLAESNLMKRTFRMNAVIAGLIDTRHPGQRKSGRQVTFSADLIYDVLRRYDPGHILLQATYTDAAAGLLDLGRLSDLLIRIKGRIMHQPLERVSPLAVPLLLDIGRETIRGAAADLLLAEAAADLAAEAHSP